MVGKEIVEQAIDPMYLGFESLLVLRAIACHEVTPYQISCSSGGAGSRNRRKRDREVVPGTPFTIFIQRAWLQVQASRQVGEEISECNA